MFRFLKPGTVALLLAAALLAVPVAAAQTTLTLTGESLVADPTSDMTVECGPTASHITYDAFGTATGPYPGTFTEHGELTLQAGEVHSFNAHFTIESGTTTITGMKELDPSEEALIASCGPAAPFTEFGQVHVGGLYTAEINGPLETSTESGRVTTVVEAGETATGTTSLTMSEAFQSGGPPGMTIELSPASAVNATGTMHTVTAVVRDALGRPVQGITVRFVIVGSSGQTARCVTDQDGICSLTYLGPDAPGGADEITACADTNLDGDGDPPTEPCAAATKAWSPGGGTTTSGAHGGGHLGAAEVVFGFSAQSTGVEEPIRGACNVFDRVLDIHVKCLDITTLLVTPGHATFSGTAEQDGIATNYTITVDDLSGVGLPDTFSITTTRGYSKSGPVTAGNIVVNP